MPKICNLRLQHHLSNQSQLSIKECSIAENSKIEIEHSFMKKNFSQNKMRTCHTCGERIKDRIYFKCQDCKINVHDKCALKTEKNCNNKTAICSSNDEESSSCNEETEPTYNNSNNAVQPSLIGVRRVSQRVRKSKNFFWQGSMAYATNDSQQILVNYWQLDSQKIHVYENSQLRVKLFEIPLNTIQKAVLVDVDQPKYKCLFYLKTANNIFNCGLDTKRYPSCVENQWARNFYNIFKMAYIPFSKGMEKKQNSVFCHFYYYFFLGARKSFKVTAPKYEEKVSYKFIYIFYNTILIALKSIEDEYIIDLEDQLGSGQFGEVYGGICKETREAVAIKVIDKTRFQDNQFETSIFQNEITILYNVKHPGIVRLDALFNEIERVYIFSFKIYISR